MSPRKPTVDGVDDVDDEDGVLEQEAAESRDLKLTQRREDEVGLGGQAADDESGQDPEAVR
jgi:hypothetical protein